MGVGTELLSRKQVTIDYNFSLAVMRFFLGIYTLKLGSGWMIVLANPALAREAYIQNADKLSDRPIYSHIMKSMEKDFGSFGKLNSENFTFCSFH